VDLFTSSSERLAFSKGPNRVGVSDVMSFMVAKCILLRNVFQCKEKPKVIQSKIRSVWSLGDHRNCCTTSDVLLGALSLSRNYCPCLPLVAPPPPNCIEQPLQNLQHSVQVVQTCGAPNINIKRIPGTFLTAPHWKGCTRFLWNISINEPGSTTIKMLTPNKSSQGKIAEG
jgi:hypothetical protein